MTWAQRAIEVSIKLGTGSFGESGADTVTLTGMRMTCAVALAGGGAQGALQCGINGMQLQLMNRLTSIGPIANQMRNNQILVAAGNKGEALTLLYSGTIDQAWADLNQAPDVVFNITARSAGLAAIKPVGVLSYPDSIDVAVIMAQLAKTMGMAFENNGVSVMLSNMYLPGCALDQVRAAARAAGIRYTIERGVLAIWPWSGARAGDIPLISPETGMRGYPTYTSYGIAVVTELMPQIRLGEKIRVQSSLTPACGVWTVTGVVHNFEAERPDGQWFTRIDAAPVIA